MRSQTFARFGFAAAAAVALGCGPDSATAPDSDALAFTHAGGGGSSIDQSQPIGDVSAGITFAIGGTPPGQVLAQVFTSGVTGKLRELEIPVGCAAGALQLEIRDAPGGIPGTTVLATESYSASSLPVVVGAFVPLRIRPSPRLLAGTQYAFVLSNPTSSCGILPGPVGDAYAGGAGYFNGPAGGWLDLSIGSGREDLPFFTYLK
jgi:hypothetical protein